MTRLNSGQENLGVERMNEIEQFMARQERYLCERLHANITKDHCALNKRQNMVACMGCAGYPRRQ